MDSIFKKVKKLRCRIVGMEPTGHYWINLSKWLYNQNIEVVTVNPHLVKRTKKNRDNTQSKSDKKRCAHYRGYGQKRLLFLIHHHQNPLRSLEF